MSSILAIGIATLDVINITDGYPAEDTEVRAVGQRVSRGGNATNTLVVLSQLGHRCAWGGVWVNDPDGQRIAQNLTYYNINISPCRRESIGKMPTSYIILNQRTGSRTIVHYRDLPEFSAADFQRIDLTQFDWLHLEGRNVEETTRMLQWARQWCPTLPISVEIEKPRPRIEQLFNADVLLFSQVFAEYQGYGQAFPFLQAMQQLSPRANLVCAWGTAGGYALTPTGTFLHSPAYPPPQVIDTLGAGDTFNAGIIDGLCRQQDLATALNRACQLAGKKCGQEGLTLVQ